MKIGTHKTTIKTSSVNTLPNGQPNKITSVCYHNTIVVKFDNYKIELDNGGYYTPTTKRRMNQASEEFNLGFKVFQKDYTWYCKYENKFFSFTGNRLTLPITH